MDLRRSTEITELESEAQIQAETQILSQFQDEGNGFLWEMGNNDMNRREEFLLVIASDVTL